jgi:hypothetical protein
MFVGRSSAKMGGPLGKIGWKLAIAAKGNPFSAHLERPIQTANFTAQQ